MDKKAQITIFIILGILIVAGVALFFISKGGIKKQEIISPEIAPIKNFVEECLDETGQEVIYNVAQGGGYYFPPEKSTKSGITYYIYNNKSYMPLKEQVETEISFFVSENLFFCVRNFADFPEYEIFQGEIKTNTKINENSVKLNVEFPLTIKKEESVSQIKNFEVEIPVRLNLVYDSINEFVNEDSENGVCLSCLLNISETNDLYIDMFDYENSTIIFIFKDENSILNDKPLEWIFANEY